MRQIYQSLISGRTELLEVPVPQLMPGHLLVQTTHSLLSAGTERMLVNFSRGSLISKAKQQPERLNDVITKAISDGFLPTATSVFSKLDEPLPLGYCNVGKVLQVSPELEDFKVGDRVVSNGPHAEIVSVPVNLCAKIPPNVTDEEAVFTVISSISLHGIRELNPTFGETILVVGLGLVGILAAQLLRANGCDVYGVDINPSAVNNAEKHGIPSFCSTDPLDIANWIHNLTGSSAVDGSLITASTRTSEPILLAAELCRKRGRIVLVGVCEINIPRTIFYKKELIFSVSCSYGPGRYDPNYELLGHDYPLSYVRWTEKRNFNAILKTLNGRYLNVKSLISHRFSLDDYGQAYNLLTSSQNYSGIILSYPAPDQSQDHQALVSLSPASHQKAASALSSKPAVAFLGCGNFATRTLLPAFNKQHLKLSIIAATQGLKPTYYGRKYKFRFATTDPEQIFRDPETDAVVIATRHSSHASFILKALRNNKHVFVEKPLCVTTKELIELQKTYNGNNLICVGYNRRFAPLTQCLHRHIKKRHLPISINYTVNAGFIDPSHWSQDKKNGGRLIGEVCHFVDLVRYLVGANITHSHLNVFNDSGSSPQDTFTITLSFDDGSIATINYFSNGTKMYSKERIEVFQAGHIYLLDNFRRLKVFTKNRTKTYRNFLQDKGHKHLVAEFVKAITGKTECPIPFDDIVDVQKTVLTLHSKLTSLG